MYLGTWTAAKCCPCILLEASLVHNPSEWIPLLPFPSTSSTMGTFLILVHAYCGVMAFVCVLLRIFWTLRVPPTNAPTVQGPFGWPIFWVLFLPPQFEIPSAATPTCRTCGTTRARALHPTRKPDAEPNEIHLRDGWCGQWTGQRNHC